MAVIYKYGLYEFPTYGRADDELLNEGKSALSDLPTSDGAWDHLGDDAYLQAGQVTHRFILVGSDYEDLDNKVDVFLYYMNIIGRQKLYWRMRDGSVRWAWAKKRSISMPRDGNNQLVLPVSITFDVPESMRYSQYGAEGIEWGSFVWGDGGMWGGGVTNKFAFSGTSTEFTVTNNGSARAYPVITIACSAVQTAENVRINRKIGAVVTQYVEGTRTIASSKELVIDCENYTVEYDGSDDYDNLAIGTWQVHWMWLYTGDNTIEVTCANGGDAGSVTFDFYPPYH